MATYKQKLVTHKLVENGGNLGKAMVDAGYSTNTAKTPQKLTESKGWKELVVEFMPEIDIVKAHKELLGAVRISVYFFPLSMPDKEIKEILESIKTNKLLWISKGKTNKKAYYSSPDSPIRVHAIDMFLKLKGHYKQPRATYKDPYEDMSDEELDTLIRQADKKNSE